MKRIKISLFISFICIAFVMACQKEKSETTGTSTLKVRMTDAPASWDEVNIDLREVRVNFRGDSSGWVSLPTTAGIYNLLDYQNGIDTLIAQGTVPAGTIQELRLVLGDSNSIVANGQTHPLTIPSGGTSGLKIKVNKKLNAGLDSLLIDFDAALSVKEENNGYKLKPVIKLK